MKSDYLRRLGAQGHLTVRKKLMEWDPIGCGVPEDEYDAYAGPIVSMLDHGKEKEEIVEYLRVVCEEYIGMAPHPKDRAEKIIDDLKQWWPKWKNEVEELGPDRLIDKEDQAERGNGDNVD